MIKTKDITVTRGQTMPILFTARDQNGARKDITGAAAYMAIRADMKVAPSVQITSVDPAPTGWRVGIVIADQTGPNMGDFTATLVPDDTQALVALGASDPYLYDVWLVLADGSRWPVVAQSRMPLDPEVTTIPTPTP